MNRWQYAGVPDAHAGQEPQLAKLTPTRSPGATFVRPKSPPISRRTAAVTSIRILLRCGPTLRRVYVPLGVYIRHVDTLTNANQRYAENLIARALSRVTPWGDSP